MFQLDSTTLPNRLSHPYIPVMLSKKMLVSWVVLAAAGALQLAQVSAQSQASQQLSSLLSNLGLGNILSAGVNQDGTLTGG